MPAIGIHHTATTDEPWDGPAAVAAMPNDDTALHYCHAWESQDAADAPHKEDDSDADDQKGSYKFPHHKTKGAPANLAACRNGLARLDGASIPDGDRAGVKAHLQAHMSDAETGKKADDSARFPLVDEGAWARAGQLGNLVSAERVRERVGRVQKVSDRGDFFRFTNSGGAVANLDIYDEIGFWGVNASDFQRQLNSVTAPSLTVHINSPGGDVFDGIAILNMLRSHPADVHVIVDGQAVSAASFISMAGKTVTMMPNSMMMIHEASGVCMGNADEMHTMAELLDKVSDNIASIYAARTKTDAKEWRVVMRAETWYSADEAVQAGLADRIGDTDTPSDVEVLCDRWNFSFYNYDGRRAAPAPQLVAKQRHVEAELPEWNPENFRLAMKERAAQ